MLSLMLGLTDEERRIQKVDVTEGIGNTPIINKNRHISSQKNFFEIFEQSKTANKLNIKRRKRRVFLPNTPELPLKGVLHANNANKRQ